MRKPEQLAELAKAGFRAEGSTPPESDVVDFAAVRPRRGRRQRHRATLADALATPAQGPAATSCSTSR